MRCFQIIEIAVLITGFRRHEIVFTNKTHEVIVTIGDFPIFVTLHRPRARKDLAFFF